MKSFVRARATVRARIAVSTAGLVLAGAVAVPATIGFGSGAAGAASPAVGGVATYTGLGFDNCGLPSVSQLAKWTNVKSPYQALNVYIGGVNAACPVKLKPTWVQGVTKLGWSIIPTYVGLQAPHPNCPCATISTNVTKANAQGVAAAKDAVKIMTAAGIKPGNPIYNDMEGYTRGKANTPAVLSFLEGWTVELHTLGYISGVYAGADTGIKDLVAKYGTSYTEPDDIWIARWDGSHTVKDPSVPAADWANHQRLHQFSGNTTISYGGVTFHGADGDYCDGAVVTAATI